MNREQIRQEIKDIIHVIAPDEDLTTLKDDAALRDQINLDSMDFLDIIMELRKRHRINVPEADYKHFVTLQASVDYLLPHLGGGPQASVSVV